MTTDDIPNTAAPAASPKQPKPPPPGKPSRYVPLESQDEVAALAKRWREHGDIAARDELITRHLRFVIKIAKEYSRKSGLKVEDLVAVGNEGLVKALKRFDPEKGTLAAYAAGYIKGAMATFRMGEHSLVRIGTTANQKKLFFNLRWEKARIGALQPGDLHPDQVKLIAERLDVPEEDVVEMNRRLDGDESLNTQVAGDEDDARDGAYLKAQDLLKDERPNPELSLLERDLIEKHRAALAAVLDEREWRIFEARQLEDDPITLEDLAAEFGVSRSRVQQIEVAAIKKLQCVARDTDSALYSLVERWAKPARKRKKSKRYKLDPRDPNWDLVVNQQMRIPDAVILVLEVDAGHGWHLLRSVECTKADESKHRAFLAGQIARWQATIDCKFPGFVPRNEWTIFIADEERPPYRLPYIALSTPQVDWRPLIVERAGPRVPCADNVSLIAAYEQQVAKILLPVAFPWHDEEQRLRAGRRLRPLSAAEWDGRGISWQWYGEKRRLFRKRKGSKLDVQKRSDTGVRPREWMALYRSQHAFFTAESQQTLEHEMFALAAKSPDAMFELVESPQCKYWTRAQPPCPYRTTADAPSTAYDYRFNVEPSLGRAKFREKLRLPPLSDKKACDVELTRLYAAVARGEFAGIRCAFDGTCNNGAKRGEVRTRLISAGRPSEWRGLWIGDVSPNFCRVAKRRPSETKAQQLKRLRLELAELCAERAAGMIAPEREMVEVTPHQYVNKEVAGKLGHRLVGASDKWTDEEWAALPRLGPDADIAALQPLDQPYFTKPSDMPTDATLPAPPPARYHEVWAAYPKATATPAWAAYSTLPIELRLVALGLHSTTITQGGVRWVTAR